MATSSRSKLVAAVSVALLIVVGVIRYGLLVGPGGKTRQVKVDPSALASRGEAPPISAKPRGEWFPAFQSVYALADGQVLKRVRKPFIPQRLEFYRARMSPAQVQNIPEGGEFYLLSYDGRDFAFIDAVGGGSLRNTLINLLGIHEAKLLGPVNLMDESPPGDLVVRKSATPFERATAFADLLTRELGEKMTLTQQDLDREAIVIRGEFAYTGPTTATAAAATRPSRDRPAGGTRPPFPPRIVIYRGQPSGDGWTSRGSRNFVGILESALTMPVVVDGTLGGAGQLWEMDNSAYLPGVGLNSEPDPAQVDEVLANLAAQSKLRFRREHRTIRTWVLTEGATSATQK